MPQATQSVDRFHVVQLLMRATDPVRCQERRESAEKHKAACPDEVRMAQEEGDPHKAPAREEGGARPCEDTSQGGARLPDGKAMQDVYGCPDKKSTAKAPDRLCSWMMHSAVAEMKSVARTLRKEREGILNWWKRGSTNSFLEGLNSVVQSARSIARGFRSIAYFRTMIF